MCSQNCTRVVKKSHHLYLKTGDQGFGYYAKFIKPICEFSPGWSQLIYVHVCDFSSCLRQVEMFLESCCTKSSFPPDKEFFTNLFRFRKGSKWSNWIWHNERISKWNRWKHNWKQLNANYLQSSTGHQLFWTTEGSTREQHMLWREVLIKTTALWGAMQKVQF